MRADLCGEPLVLSDLSDGLRLAPLVFPSQFTCHDQRPVLLFFGKAIREQAEKEYGPEGLWLWKQYIATYVLYVAVGLLSFVLNRKRFSLSRFLVYATAAVLWGVMIRFWPNSESYSP